MRTASGHIASAARKLVRPVLVPLGQDSCTSSGAILCIADLKRAKPSVFFVQKVLPGPPT